MRSLLALVAAAAASLPTNDMAALALVAPSRSRIRSPSSSSSASSPVVVPAPLSPPSPGMLLESTVEETLERTGAEKGNLSPFLQGMVDEQRELQMNVGKAMDVLRKDYPYFLKRAPGRLLH